MGGDIGFGAGAKGFGVLARVPLALTFFLLFVLLFERVDPFLDLLLKDADFKTGVVER